MLKYMRDQGIKDVARKPIAYGVEYTKQVFAARFNNKNPEKNWSPLEQKYLIEEVKGVLDNPEYSIKRFASIPKSKYFEHNFNMEELIEFAKTDPTIARLQEEHNINIWENFDPEAWYAEHPRANSTHYIDDDHMELMADNHTTENPDDYC